MYVWVIYEIGRSVVLVLAHGDLLLLGVGMCDTPDCNIRVVFISSYHSFISLLEGNIIVSQVVRILPKVRGSEWSSLL